MNNNPKRSQKSKADNRRFNGWKWAFLGLVGLISVAFIYVASSLQPVTVNEANKDSYEQMEEAVTMSTTLNKADAEVMINAYLSTEIGEDFEGYQIALTDQLEVHGTVNVFGFNPPFTLYFNPYVLENGNIQLRGEKVELANFSLPVSAVMSLFVRQVNLPEFIAVDSESQLVAINLNEMTEDFSFDLSMDKINLEDDEIRMNLYLDRDLISNDFKNN